MNSMVLEPEASNIGYLDPLGGEDIAHESEGPADIRAPKTT